MTEITPDFIRGVLAGRDYEKEINAKEKVCHHTRHTERPYCVQCDPVGEWLQLHTDKVHDNTIKDVLNVLEHKIVMIDDIHKHMSKNGQILLDYNKKIILTLMKDISDLL